MFIRFLFLLLVSSVCLFSIENEEPWVLLVKQCDNEKIMVRFPEDPAFNFYEDEMRHHFYSDVFDVQHHLKIEQREKRERDEIFNRILSDLENCKEVALISTKQKNSKKKTYLDIKAQVENTGYYESRIYLSKHHIFTLETQYPSGVNSTHNDFVKSFQLVT